MKTLGLALVTLLGAACTDTETLADYPCPDTGTALRYDGFGRDFFAAHCHSCHSNASNGAPRAYRFDTHAEIQQHATRIFARSAGSNVTMPPGPDDPPAQEREQLAEWLGCGAP